MDGTLAEGPTGTSAFPPRPVTASVGGRGGCLLLVQGFLVFLLWVRVCDDPGSHLIDQALALAVADQGADGDIERAFAIKAEPDDDTAVNPARLALECGDHFHGTYFLELR